jgi:hypothetical protein
MPGVEVKHLWQLFALKRKWKNLSRPGTPPPPPASPRLGHDPAGGGGTRVASFHPLLNFSIDMV